jgi:hypothetical protein
VSSPKEICWGPTIYCIKQNKRKLKAKVKTLDGAWLTWELLLLQSPATAPEKLLDGV